MELTYIVAAVVIIGVAALLLFIGSRGETRVVLGASSKRSTAAAENEENDGLTREVQSLLDQGRKIEAIKTVQERTSMPLEAAKDMVEILDKVRTLGTTTLSVTTRTTTLTQQDTAEVHRLIRQGEKIEAIKLIRDRTGLGLKEAKDIADQLG